MEDVFPLCCITALEREHLLVGKKALRYFNTDVYIVPCDEDWPLENMNRCRSNQHIYQLQMGISVHSVGDSNDTAVIICHVNNIPARPTIHFKCIQFVWCQIHSQCGLQDIQPS